MRKVVIGFLLFLSNFSFATENYYFSSKEENIRQIIKTKAYPGGKDEEPLKVQQQVPSASRKMLPIKEAPEQEFARPVEQHETND